MAELSIFDRLASDSAADFVLGAEAEAEAGAAAAAVEEDEAAEEAAALGEVRAVGSTGLSKRAKISLIALLSSLVTLR